METNFQHESKGKNSELIRGSLPIYDPNTLLSNINSSTKIVCEYDQEIPQSQTAGPVGSCGRKIY